MSTRRAAALVIGNEILSGKVSDANTPVLARLLRECGVDLRRVLVVPDVRADIVEGTRELLGRFDLVFSSGGVGPTHDDITLEAVAEALGRPLERNAEMAAMLAGYHDVARNPEALRMADLPRGARLVWGEGLRVPVVVVDRLYILPGVPSIFAKKLEALRGELEDEPFHLRQVLVSSDEVAIAAALFALSARHPELLLGSYPADLGVADYRVKLTLESKDRGLVESALLELLQSLPEDALPRVF